jgi:cell division protein FtsA
MAKHDTHIVGIDIGTSKIGVIIAKLLDSGEIEIVGMGKSDAKGMRRGSISNLKEVEGSIKSAVLEAESMSGYSIQNAFISVGGCYLNSINSRGVVAIGSKDKIINHTDVNRVLQSSSSITLSGDQKIFHTIPQEFIVDDQDGISDPAGMFGQRLEANVHILTASVTSLQNIGTVIHNSGIEVAGFVFNLLADSYSVLTPEEMELGVALINIGHGTTGIAVFEKGAICHSHIIPIGGEHFTNDLSVGLKTGTLDAEIVKKKYGCALSSMVSEDEMVEVSTASQKKSIVVPKIRVAEILEPRCEELLQLLYENIRDAKLIKAVNSGLVLTGGGALLPGVTDIAEKIFDHHTRIGEPMGISGLTNLVGTPIFSTSVGLVIYGARSFESGKLSGKKGFFSRTFGKLFEYFE